MDHSPEPGGRGLDAGAHACALYDGDEELGQLLRAYVADGVRRNEKIIYVADASHSAEALDRLRRAGVQVEPLILTGQLAVAVGQDVHGKAGGFDPDAVLERLERHGRLARAEGYTGLRAAGEMAFLAGRPPGAQRLLEYEARLARAVREVGCRALCLYDRRRLAPEILLAALESHPVAVRGLRAYRNPFFLPPAALLAADPASARLEHRLQELEQMARRTGERDLSGEARDRALLEAAVRQVSEAIVIATFDPGRRAHGIVYVNPAFTRLTGYGETEVLGRGFERLLGPRSDPFLLARLHRSLEERRPFAAETVARRSDGSDFILEWVAAGIAEEGGTLSHVVSILRDVTARRRVEETMRKADHDPLTGLANRTLFIRRLGRAIEGASRRPGVAFAVLFLDLDRFKVVNDSLGHLAGDQLLVAAARAIEECVRPGDTVARLGGDEFAVLLEGTEDVGDATAVAERILERLAAPFDLAGHEIFTGASIGIAMSATGYRLPEDVLRDADAAMYRAKALGKSRYEVFDTALHARAVALLRLETELRRAVERDEFRVHYQPITHLESGRIAGFEALVRWAHPERGLVKPGDFMAPAEEMGLVEEIDRRVLEEACRTLQLWQDRFANPTLAAHVNLSTRTLTGSAFPQQLERILAESGLDPDRLRLELPEGALAERGGAAPETLHRLNEMGVGICVDDFGTGYWSLASLHHSPVRMLKIDRFFVARMGLQPGNSQFVGTLIALGLNLGLEIIAVGVETAYQRTQLRALKCHYGQGDLFSRALPPEAAVILLESGRGP